jgi:ATP-dependent DNA ligase
MKRTTALYVPGKKPANNWVKGKKKITLDVVITGYNDGTGKNKSLFGSIEFGLYVDGTLKKMGNTSSGLDDNTRQMIAADPDKYIGTVVEIEAIQESRNSFRNAVFLRLRDDKSGSECTPLGVHVKENLLEGV